MRCPYCGGLNPDTARYCIRCGRDFASQKPSIQNQPPRVGTPPVPSVPYQPPPPQPVQQRVQQMPMPPQVLRQQVQPDPVAPPTQRRRRSAQSPAAPAGIAKAAPEPEAPAPFPPKTTAQMRELLRPPLEAPFTLVSDIVSNRKKRIVRITFPYCAAWQQVATLLTAFNRYDDEKYDTIVIQGIQSGDIGTDSFTNGQLVFDRNVRLGSQIIKRFQVETGNGYSSDAIRFVLTE